MLDYSEVYETNSLMYFEDYTFMVEPELDIKSCGLKKKRALLSCEEPTDWLEVLLNDTESLTSNISTSCEAEEKKFKAKRKKFSTWNETEIFQIWQGIARFGNEWRNVEGYIESRDHVQVKDKGRRLLKRRKWSSTRKGEKKELAKYRAMQIARKELRKRTEKKPSDQRGLCYYNYSNLLKIF